MKHSYNFIDISGRKYNHLTVVKFAYSKIVGKRGDKSPYYLCRCDCGNEKIVCGYCLKSGQTKSCGCQKIASSAKTLVKYNQDVENHNYHRTHNHTYTRLYKIYHGMKSRCYNTNVKEYRLYGGRGIIICDEWLNNSSLFFEWAEKTGYKEELTIDRIDVNGNYEPTNCRWVTMKVQENNKRNNHSITINGEIKTVTEWANIYGIKRNTVYERIRRGMDEITALIKPVDIRCLHN
jgi:hypothetical protein